MDVQIDFDPVAFVARAHDRARARSLVGNRSHFIFMGLCFSITSNEHE
jgi:hypothetical protein